jgi:uncharacterized protein YjiS (DUF1127 family)
MTMLMDQFREVSAASRRREYPLVSMLWAADAAALRAVSVLQSWLERACQRRELLGLGDRALKDFGASRCDAAGEGDKPFWRG